MQVLIKSATLIDSASDHHNKKRDLLISNGIIEKIAAKIDAPDADLIIEKPNLHISQGWFDSSVCFGEPGYEQRETLENGMRVSAGSGLCHVAINPNTDPVTDAKAQVGFILQKTAKSPVNAQVVGALTKGSKGNDQAEMFDMYLAGCRSFYDYKHPVDDVNLLKLSLQYTAPFGGLVQSFPYERGISLKGVMHEGTKSTMLGLKGMPATAETIRIERDLAILEYTGGSLHIPTISAAGSVALIREAKARGLDVSTTVAAHHLLLTDSALDTFDTHYKVQPPLRELADQQALLEGLKDGTIDGVTSDHNPLDIEAKKKEFDLADFGTIGLESLFGATNKAIGLDATIEALTRLRIRFGIETYPLAEGNKAVISLFDPEVNWTVKEDMLESFSKNSIFIGETLKGKAFGIVNGNKVHVNQ